MFRLLRETPDDVFEVEMLLDLAFAPGRGALSSYKLRNGVEPIADLCTIVRDEYDVVVACIRFWPVEIGEARTPALLLGPIAVHPTRQSEGLGALLIGQSLDRARELGWKLVLLVGDPPYYNRFGFRAAAPLGIRFPPPVNLERLLIRELAENATHGVTGMVSNWTGGGV
ncbi:N-acetyltransferase [Rhodobacteraceae bacterium NNCM2]|nr:N-acetyltransferase [Coraliihabitans acroporae]